MKFTLLTSALFLGLIAYVTPAHALQFNCESAEYNAQNVLIDHQQVIGVPAAKGPKMKALLQNKDKTLKVLATGSVLPYGAKDVFYQLRDASQSPTTGFDFDLPGTPSLSFRYQEKNGGLFEFLCQLY